MSATNTIDEGAILLACQQGNTQAFGAIVEKYKHRAYHTALGLVGSHEDARDLSQEAFVRAFRKLKSFDPAQRFFTWYYQILRNLCLNLLRDRRRHALPFSQTGERDLHEIVDPGEDSATSMERNEIRVAVWKAIQSLPESSREVIALKDFQDLSYKEIADLIGCPVGTVMSRLYHARRALREKLEGYWP